MVKTDSTVDLQRIRKIMEEIASLDRQIEEFLHKEISLSEKV